MTQATQAPSTPSMTGLEIEQCTAEEEAKSAFDVVASYVECQAVILVAEAAQRMSEQTVEKERTKRWDCLAGTAMTRKLDTSWASSLHAKRGSDHGHGSTCVWQQCEHTHGWRQARH